MNSSSPAKAYFLGLVGGVIGAVAGYFAEYALLQQAIWAPLVPQAALGFGAGWFARRRLVPLGVLCGVAGLVFGLFLQWRFFPFNADQSVGYFITHIHTLSKIDLLLIAIGGYLSYRLAVGFEREPTPSS